MFRTVRLIQAFRHLSIVHVVVLHYLLEVLLRPQLRPRQLDHAGEAVRRLARTQHRCVQLVRLEDAAVHELYS